MSAIRLFILVAASIAAAALVYVLSAGIAGVPPLGTLLDPADGLYRTARAAQHPPDSTTLALPALDAPVTVVRDERSVPHVFAESDRDAIVALGYLVAQDRLFQLDFIPRVASGRLSEAFGEGSVQTDRFLRSTGMEWGTQKNLQRIEEEGGIEKDLLDWYSAGVNAYLGSLPPEDLPFEFRMLGYEPDAFSPVQAMRVLQYMTYDLTYGSDDAEYGLLRAKLDSSDYAALYPEHPVGLFEPIIPPSEMGEDTPVDPLPQASGAAAPGGVRSGAALILAERSAFRSTLRGTLAEGYVDGKGSNNWAVDASRSATGAPILAGDMHLSLSLPPIWYEIHLKTPTMDAHGLTVPGAPVLVQAFTRNHSWAFTNTAADQIDHYALTVDSARTRYRYDGGWRDLQPVVDTIRVKDAAPVVDTLYYSHYGPVHFDDDTESRLAAVAEQWVAHKPSTTLRALWGMVHADSLGAFESALRDWDTPMQNVLYAGRDGNVAIRSTGRLPLRATGTGQGLRDGASPGGEWVGRVPFEGLPYSRNPEHGFLTSSNQKPTNDQYPYYLNHDWGDGWRSLRLDTLLSGKSTHGVEDFQAYHADVDVQQRDAFVPLLADLPDLSPRADSLRAMLQAWDGTASLDRPEPVVLDHFLDEVRRMAWDEAELDALPKPADAVFLRLLTDAPTSPWLDVQATPEREDAQALLTRALEATADTVHARYGSNPDAWRWGDHHDVVFRHLTRSNQLQALWRGPFPYPGFSSTVSPARGRTATHSASQRLIVDFSTDPPRALGVIPGGQSGNPLDPRFYDDQLDAYVNFRYYPLHLPQRPSDLPDSLVTRRTTLRP